MPSGKRIRRVLTARLPVEMEVPAAMAGPVEMVLAGEYEAGLFGEGLEILDLGANVGAFTLWANLRWPRSRIHCYEPHPGTFGILRRNLARLNNVVTHNAAVFPGRDKRVLLYSQYDGDGEASLLKFVREKFAAVPKGQTIAVPVVHPEALPSADIVKLDVEGSEAEVIRWLDLSQAGLVVLEYHNDANRAAIKRQLAEEFELEREDSFAWDDLLVSSDLYRSELAGDHYGHLYFVSREQRRLWRA